ncbi:MAG: hypothetical protein U5J98_03415 [Halobacteriales archaeon]|nr:hypothetical protein [Halobacteriales archaeon]
MRGPLSDTLLDGLAGDAVDATGGPLGVVTAGGFVVATTVVLAALVIGTEALLEGILGPWLPGWLVMPILVGSVGVVIVGAFVGVLRVMTWRRRRW